MTFNDAETAACRHLVELALREDLGDVGDRTSVILPVELRGQANIVARQDGTVSGLCVVERILDSFQQVRLTEVAKDGERVGHGEALASLFGPVRSILIVERTALNFLQHLSGIATLTRRFVDAIAGLPCQILDTRKTTPGWRLMEKYAVRCGGGHNHRSGLFDGILIKDNHLVALGGGPEAIKQAVTLARRSAGGSLRIEVEVENLNQLNAAFSCGPDIILLDNMPNDLMRECVRRRNAAAPKILLEASGGITLDTVRAVAETGVDRISVGALTHSAPALDIALDYLPS